MKASLLTAVLLLALAAAPTEAMERSNSAGSLPTAGGRPMPLQHQGTLARLHGKGDVKKKIAQHMGFINQAGQPDYQRLQPNSQQMNAVKNFLSRHKGGRQITNDEAETFNEAVHRRVSEIELQARNAAGSNPGEYNKILAGIARQQSRLLVANIQNQNGALNDANLVEAQALASLLNQGKPDYSAHIKQLLDALDAWEAAQQPKPSADAQQPAASVQVNFDRQRVPAVTQFEGSFPEREIRWREARERVRHIVEDPSEAAVMLIALGVEPERAIPATVDVFNSRKSIGRLSGTFDFGDDNPFDGSPRASKKLGIVHGTATNIHGASSGSSHNAQKDAATVISLDPTNIQSSGQSSHSPRGSLIREGSGSNLFQGKCYIVDPMTLRTAIAQHHVPLKFYGRDDFTVGQIGKVESKSLTSGKSSLAQGSLYSYVFAIFAKRSAAMQQSINGKYWETSAYLDLTLLSSAKGYARKIGKFAKNFNPLHTKKTKIVDEEYVNYVASIFFHKCIPQNCEQRDIYGFYKALVRGLNGLEADLAISLIQQQLGIEIQRAKTLEYVQNVLPNPCPTEPNPERF